MSFRLTPARMQRRVKGDRLMFTNSDDAAMTKQLESSHAPDGVEIDVKPILLIVEDIFLHANNPTLASISSPGTEAHVEALLADQTLQASTMELLESLAFVIDRVASEMSCTCFGGGDAHGSAMAILKMLGSFSWDAKLVIVLAAFAMNYGEFWLIAQNYTSNQLAKAVAILKQLPEILEKSNSQKPLFDAVKNLIKTMLDIGKCVIKFKELPSEYITSDVAALSMAMSHIPIAVYWTVRSIVACASQITGLVGQGHGHLVATTEAWELSSLGHKLSNMCSHLEAQLGTCYKHIDEKKFIHSYQNLIHLFETMQIDNMKILKALIYAKDDLQPLVDCASKKRVHLDVLRKKNVLLLISSLDILQEELAILEQIYNESRVDPTRRDIQYEVVWVPIVDPAIPWTEMKQKQFENLQSTMRWYSVHHPSVINDAAIKFIKEVWNFGEKTILVVLDPQGQVASPNALHMMWIWGSAAFPFTSSREEALWKEETWRLELLVDGIDPMILQWMSEDKYICLYGGEDMEWIRKFTGVLHAAANAAGIPLEMAYVGKSNPKERVRKNISMITADNLSYCWQELTSIWYFWIRIESMWHSKNQLRRTVENDPIMQEIMTFLSYDGSEDGWAILCRGSGEMVRAKGTTFITCLTDFTSWETQVQQIGFLPALKQHLMELHTPHHCNRLVLPGTSGTAPERVVCSECGRSMERFIMYQCCDE
ncbi:Protein SIEVE ELEMENT OCCLUSION B [Linum grandiflorum]